MSNIPQQPTENIQPSPIHNTNSVDINSVQKGSQPSPTPNTSSVDINSVQKLSQPETYNVLKKLKIFFLKTDTSLSLIVNFLTLSSLFIGGYLYIDKKVNQTFLDKFSPYENLQVGKALIDDSEYDEAIPDLEKAFKKLGDRFAKDEVLSGKYYLIMDYYLYAIVNSKAPYLYERRFKELLKLEKENKISFRAWHYHQLAWYYFRTGAIKEAKINFQKAIERYKAEEDPESSADQNAQIAWGSPQCTSLYFESAYAPCINNFYTSFLGV